MFWSDPGADIEWSAPGCCAPPADIQGAGLAPAGEHVKRNTTVARLPVQFVPIGRAVFNSLTDEVERVTMPGSSE